MLPPLSSTLVSSLTRHARTTRPQRRRAPSKGGAEQEESARARAEHGGRQAAARPSAVLDVERVEGDAKGALGWGWGRGGGRG